jgi:hypothetical protein
MAALVLQDLPLRRIASAGAVLVLHLIVLGLWLNASTAVRPKSAPLETILYLSPPRPKPEIKPAVPAMPQPKVRALTLPDRSAITVPTIKDNDAKALQGLGRALFDCRVENLSRLTPEQQAACASASSGMKRDDSVDFADHTNRVRDAALWARQKARKNGPALLPCASTQSIYATLSTATLACLANGAINGMNLDAQPMYGDKPEAEGHVPNNGDPPPPYTAPDH